MPAVLGTIRALLGFLLLTSTTTPTTTTTTMVFVPLDFNTLSQREIFKEILRFELKGRKSILGKIINILFIITLNNREMAILVGANFQLSAVSS
jgi:hypothetical protein